MGVTKLKPLLNATDTEGEFMKDVPPDEGSVILDDFPVRINKMAIAAEVPYDEYITRLASPYINHTLSPHARILWIMGDYSTVTSRKQKTQQKRSRARRCEPYPKTACFRVDGLYDSLTKQTYRILEPNRVAASRHLRESLAEVVWAKIQAEGIFPDHVFLFFDIYPGKPVPMLHRGKVFTVEAAANVSAEAEVRGVYRIMQMLHSYSNGVVTCGTLPPVPLSIVLRSVDTDVIPVLLYQLWDYPLPDGCSIAAVLDRGFHIDFRAMVRVMRERGWTKELLLVACGMLGTDYTEKKDYLWKVGEEFAWTAWDATAGANPHRAGHDLDKVLESLAAVAFVHKMRGMTETPILVTRNVMMDYFRKSTNSEFRNSQFFKEGRDKAVNGKDNMEWLCKYWVSLGHVTGDELTQRAGGFAPMPVVAPRVSQFGPKSNSGSVALDVKHDMPSWLGWRSSSSRVAVPAAAAAAPASASASGRPAAAAAAAAAAAREPELGAAGVRVLWEPSDDGDPEVLRAALEEFCADMM